MPQRFDESAGRRIGDAVRDIEKRSAAELVVVVRARAGSYAHADARFAALLALVSLAVLVYMPFVVPPVLVLLDPVAFYLLGNVVSRRSDGLRRLFTSRADRAEAVRTRAAALFHERRISETQAETGLLLFASLLERRMEIVADRGVLRAVDPAEWNAMLADLHMERTLDPDALQHVLDRLGDLLARALPAGETNRDELPSLTEIEVS